MAGYLFFSFFLVGFVYPVCAHAYWSFNGFLSTFAAEPLWGQGVIDFAGSGPVHMCGGTAALIMCYIIGPRTGRFYDSDGNLRDEPKAMGPHSVTLMVSTNCDFFAYDEDFSTCLSRDISLTFACATKHSFLAPLASGLVGMDSTLDPLCLSALTHKARWQH